MKRLRDYFELVVFILLIGLTILSSINIAKVKALKTSIENNTSIEVSADAKDNKQTVTNSCSHNWVVLDRELAAENTDSLITCKKCGDLKLIDYLNHKIRD